MSEADIAGDLWQRYVGFTPETTETLKHLHGVDITTIDDMYDDEERLYLPLRVMVRSGDVAELRRILIIMDGTRIITVQDTADFSPFPIALRQLRRHPEALVSPLALLCFVLDVLNQQAGKAVAALGAKIEDMSELISEMMRSLHMGDDAVGTGNINETLLEMNDMETLVSRCLEIQLSLARAARYLDMEVSPNDGLQAFVRTLRDDIAGVKEHAAFEHDSVRYLQNALMTALNVKQNQIVKIFTIVTAVFLPPTLIASIYGMNFKVMPELAWKHGFPVVILMTAVAAFLPLLYIKRRGWLR